MPLPCLVSVMSMSPRLLHRHRFKALQSFPHCQIKAEQPGSCQRNVYLHQKRHPLHPPEAPQGQGTALWEDRELEALKTLDTPAAATVALSGHTAWEAILPHPLWVAQALGRAASASAAEESSFIHRKRLLKPFAEWVPGEVILTAEKKDRHGRGVQIRLDPSRLSLRPRTMSSVSKQQLSYF